MDKRYDAVIIGAGVVGCAIARELSRYQLSVLLLDKHSDVALETSGRNSGVAHAGFYVPTGTLKAKLNVLGHAMLPGICKELGVPYIECGKIVTAKEDEEREYLYKLKETGDKNGSRGLKIIGKEEINKLEPNINGIEALHSPLTAILDPFILTIALAENAQANGVEVRLNTEVKGVEEKNGFVVETNNGKYCTDFVINSAGLYSDKIAAMVGINDYTIYPCRGEYHILDKNKRTLINGAVYPVPPKELGGLGIHLTPTTDGNIMLGPSAEYLDERDDYSNTAAVMDNLFQESFEFLPRITRKDIIKSFSGIRPKLICKGSKKPVDFVIEESGKVPGFINLIGVESPGLTGAPAIAEMIAEIISRKKVLKKKTNFVSKRKAQIRFADLSIEEKSRLIKENSDYGVILCRCQEVTKKEVLDALNNPFGAKNIQSIAKRCRATFGRCQGGFCMPKIVELIEEELKAKPIDITFKGTGSELFTGRREGLK